MSNKLLVLYTFIFLMIFDIDAFASEDYRLYQKDLREFSVINILKSFVRGIELNKDRIVPILKQANSTKNIDETVLDMIDIYDYNNYSSGIRIFKVYQNEGINNQDILGFVIVSYDSLSNALLTPVLIRSNLENVSVNENDIAFNLISAMNEFLGKKDKVAIPYTWLISDRYFKQLIEDHKISSSSRYLSQENDTYLLNLESLNLKKLKLKEPYGVSEVPVFSSLGEKILDNTIFPEELSIKYKFDQLKRVNIHYKIIISVLEQIEILRQRIYGEENTNFIFKKEPTLLNYFKVAEHIEEGGILEFFEMHKEGFNIRRIYGLIRDTYFYEDTKEKVRGMKLLGELLSFISVEQIVELQKIALRNEEFLSIVLWDIKDISLKRDIIIGLLWENTEYSQELVLKIFDKYKGVRDLEIADVEILLTVLDFVQENNYSIQEIDDIVKKSSWKKSLKDKKNIRKIIQKLNAIMKQYQNGCKRYFSK